MNREQSIEFIQAIEDTKALERAILDIIDELKSEDSKEIADGLEQLIPISNNRFSVIGQKELLQESKRRAISILKSEPKFNHVSEKEACCIVERVLGNMQLYLQDMFKRQPHTKCTDSILSIQKCFDIGNEYDLQHIVYALLRAVFPLARIEEYQDAGACAVRKDICIDEFDIAIELKCTRDSLSAKKLSEEVASDIVHYDNKNIFFLIYDKARIIDNIDVFRDTYEKTDMCKNVKVFVML